MKIAYNLSQCSFNSFDTVRGAQDDLVRNDQISFPNLNCQFRVDGYAADALRTTWNWHLEGGMCSTAPFKEGSCDCRHRCRYDSSTSEFQKRLDSPHDYCLPVPPGASSKKPHDFCQLEPFFSDSGTNG